MKKISFTTQLQSTEDASLNNMIINSNDTTSNDHNVIHSDSDAENTISSATNSDTDTSNINDSDTDKATVQLYSGFNLNDDGSIICNSHLDYVPVLKALLKKGCPKEREISVCSEGSEISFHVKRSSSPVHDETGITLLYFGRPIKFWREIKVRKDLKYKEYVEYKKNEQSITFDELEQFVNEFQRLTAHAINNYYYNCNWNHFNTYGDIWKQVNMRSFSSSRA